MTVNMMKKCGWEKVRISSLPKWEQKYILHHQGKNAVWTWRMLYPVGHGYYQVGYKAI